MKNQEYSNLWYARIGKLQFIENRFKLLKSKGKFSLVVFQQCFVYHLFQIIDSIMALFRVDFCGRGELADRQQKLAQMLSRLQKLSEGKQ